MNKSRGKPIIIGAMITAGTSVGAGMFSLPVVSSGMWFILSILSLLFLCWLSYISAMYLLEANLHFKPGASFDTLVAGVLGVRWNVATGIAMAFMFYTLLYAYFSGIASIIATILEERAYESGHWVPGGLSLLFGGLLSAIVWLSTGWVGRLSTILVAGMAVSFAWSVFGFASTVDSAKLFNHGHLFSEYIPFIWAAWPYYITSFGFTSVVPSLYKYYGNNPNQIRKSLSLGACFAVLVYCLFIFISFGNISREAFVEINLAGGNIGDLVQGLSKIRDVEVLNLTLTAFSNFAIISSFLGVGLGLFDYIADKFSFSDSKRDRFFVACLTFIPPGLASLFFPNGFIAAIGFAGLVLIYGFFILPYMMVARVRKMNSNSGFSLGGGKLLLNFFLFASLMIAAFYVLGMLNYLPKW